MNTSNYSQTIAPRKTARRQYAIVVESTVETCKECNRTLIPETAFFACLIPANAVSFRVVQTIGKL